MIIVEVFYTNSKEVRYLEIEVTTKENIIHSVYKTLFIIRDCFCTRLINTALMTNLMRQLLLNRVLLPLFLHRRFFQTSGKFAL